MSEADFQRIFQSHKDVVYRFACRMTGSSSTAEDVVQDCFLAIWRSPHGYDAGRGAMRAYLLGVARNLILKRWRGEQPHEELTGAALEEEAVVAFLPVESLMRQSRADTVRSAVMALPPLQREAVIMAEYEELSLEEISTATGTEIAAVKSRLHRARNNLRRMLEPLLAIER